MFFSVIIPTYKRPQELIKSVSSVLDGNYNNYEVIIVNGSPEYDYSHFLTFFKNHPLKNKVKYFSNITEVIGNNSAKNFALQNVSLDSDYVTFLDDDDWFSVNALAEVSNFLTNQKVEWLMTNRIKVGGDRLTFIPENLQKFNYFFSYLIGRKIKGDATHFLNTAAAKDCYFSKKVKNGEEWFYFSQIPTATIYQNFNTTISNGYQDGGLNAQMQINYKKNTWLLWREVRNWKIFLYLVLRTIKAVLK